MIKLKNRKTTALMVVRKVRYFAADYIQEESPRIVIWKELSEKDYFHISDLFMPLDFFRDSYSIKEMALECGTDVINYFHALESYMLPADELEMTSCLITANKHFINYLSFLKTFFDVVSNNISKISRDQLKEFKNFDSKLYDASFDYRFLKRMRNYVVHCKMPLKYVSVRPESGTRITCRRDDLLEFSGWSSLKNEISLLPEHIDIVPYVYGANASIMKLYMKAIGIIKDDVVALRTKLKEIYGETKVACPIILIEGDDIHTKQVEQLPVRYIEKYYLEIEKYKSYINFIM